MSPHVIITHLANTTIILEETGGPLKCSVYVQTKYFEEVYILPNIFKTEG